METAPGIAPPARTPLHRGGCFPGSPGANRYSQNEASPGRSIRPWRQRRHALEPRSTSRRGGARSMWGPLHPLGPSPRGGYRRGLLRPRGDRPAPPRPAAMLRADQDPCAAQFDGARRRHPAAGSPRSPRPRSRTRERTEARQRQSRAKALHAEGSWTTTCLLTP
jgi:hypothetical protein